MREGILEVAFIAAGLAFVALMVADVLYPPSSGAVYVLALKHRK